MRTDVFVFLLFAAVLILPNCRPEVTVQERYTHGRRIGERLEKTLEEHGFRIRKLQLFTVDPPEPCPKEVKKALEEKLRTLLSPYISPSARWTLYVTRVTFETEQEPRYILSIEAKLEDFDGRCAWRRRFEKRTLASRAQGVNEIRNMLLLQCCEELVSSLPLTKEPPEKVGE